VDPITLPFGRYAGVRLDQVPGDYLRWLVEEQVCRSDRLREAVAEEWERRQEAEDAYWEERRGRD
jgi:hypothetical protein